MESIFVRVQRLVSTGVNDAADAVERVSSASLMRQAIREVEQAADKVRDEREAVEARRAQAVRQEAIIRERLATLLEQARFALSKGREDLAETAVSHQIDAEAQLAELKKIQADAIDAARQLDESRAALKLRRAEMVKELVAFEAAQRESATIRVEESPADHARRKAERAEENFERAMAAAGGPTANLTSAEDAARLAEVVDLQKQSKVAERMAALRAAKEAGTSGGKPRKKAGSR